MNQENKKIVAFALREDAVRQDITSRKILGRKERIQATIVSQEAGILCGVQIAARIFRKLDGRCKVKFYARDGQKIKANQKILTVNGKAIALLAAERTALNFLQHLSGVATLTKKFVDATKGTKAKIYDTRKTIPGLRTLQKYAVRCGGGINHRMNLSEMAMVKENHLKAARSSKSEIQSLKEKLPQGMKLEMEAKNLKEVEMALKAKADILLLDNMTIPQLKKSIAFVRSYRNPLTAYRLPLIEVSGGVTLQNVRQIAKLGVDRISVGALTHSAPALNLSMEVL